MSSYYQKAHRHQKAVLWEATGQFDRYGKPLVSGPVEIMVRWVIKKEEMTTAGGEVVNLEGFVVVDREIREGSQMWKGSLEDWYGSGSAGDDSEVMETTLYKEVPDVKGRRFRRTLRLRKFKDQPTG